MNLELWCMYTGLKQDLAPHTLHGYRIIWLVIFTGTNFHETGIFTVLILAVSEFGTCMLAVWLKAERMSRIVYRVICSNIGKKIHTLVQPD